MTAYFPSAQGTTIGSHANFQAIAGNSTIVHNYNTSEREDRLTLRGRTVRKVIDGDIIFQRDLLSKVLCVNIKPDGASTSTESQVVKVKKMEQTAGIYGYRGKFTTTSFEPVDEKDQDKFREIAKIVLEAAMRGRSALLKQVFAVAESENAMTLIVHNELATGDEITDWAWGKEWVLFYYLHYTHSVAVQSLHADETVTFPVANTWEDWSFNPKNLTWQYDPVSLCLDPPEEEVLRPFLYSHPPPSQETPRQLDPAEIVAHLEESFGDVFYLIASHGKRSNDLSYYARYGFLTLGTVVDCWEPGILAHLPSTPSPEWFCFNHTPGMKASHSSSGRVDFSFQKTGNVQVELDFGWLTPEKDRNQLNCTFLCQSLHFGDNCDDVTDVVYIEEVGFTLQGTFPIDPTNHSTPAYLFVKPLPTVLINNLHCVCYPFPEKLFYWANDLQGRNVIAEEDWERFGIPELSITEWVGTYWEEEKYTIVQEHLDLKGYDLDGKQYTYDHGYPEFIFADPHDTTRIEDLDYSELHPETCLPLSEPTSPSSPSPTNTPVIVHNNTATLSMASVATHWAKPGFLKKFYNLVSETVTHADDLGFSVAAC
ncbi:hypothetical protein PQX77_021879 [Marasmius sp. AFHP31]|nr:hypothetical protein PQX77_021879 [Marasmius sp. AFHP31]